MKLSDFSLFDDENDSVGIHQVVHEFNQARSTYPQNQTVHRTFAQQAARTPESVALIVGEQTLTYRELDEQSNRFARFLIGRGISSESVVGVIMNRSVDMIVALLGVLKAGGCYLPLNPSLPFSRARYILKEAGCSFVISEKSVIRTLNKLQWECPELHAFLCVDTYGVHHEPEEVGEMMREEMWNYIRRDVFDDISGGGWRSSYTGRMVKPRSHG